MELVWTTPGHDNRYTIHKAGCTHLRRVRDEDILPLAATDIAGAMAEVMQDDLGLMAPGETVEDYVHVSPCAR